MIVSIGRLPFWCDIDCAVGALISGLIADFFGFEAAILAIAVVALIFGAVFAILGREERGR
jgi:predicted MFS family arabinose efflux permease